MAYECPTLLKRELHELYSHLSALRECNTVILARKRVPANSQEQGIDITENCEQDRSVSDCLVNNNGDLTVKVTKVSCYKSICKIEIEVVT